MARLVLLLLVLISSVVRAGAIPTPAPPPEIVRYERDRLTIRVTDVPLDRVLAQVAAVTHATIQGQPAPRAITLDFESVPLSQGLGRMLGEDSFMLTYGPDGTLRTIKLLGRGTPPALVPSAAPSPRPPLSEEESQATILQREVTVTGPLAGALGTEHPTIGRILHAVVMERDASVRAAAREETLATFARDPEIEAAYLSTLAPVDDAVLARMMRDASASSAGAQEWMTTLATRAPSPPLREKATAVLNALGH